MSALSLPFSSLLRNISRALLLQLRLGSTLSQLWKIFVKMRGFGSALIACALILDVTVALKHPRFRDVSRRGQDKANKAVREATHVSLNPRQANSSTDAGFRYLSNTTAS